MSAGRRSVRHLGEENVGRAAAAPAHAYAQGHGARWKVVVSGPNEQVVVGLAGTTTIGRDDGNNLVLRDQKVSREHAMIHMQRDGTFMVIDLGSLNGTYLNGVRVAIPARLRPGDVVAVGASTLRVSGDDDHVRKSSDDEMANSATLINLDKREITVLVADVRGYTTLSERLPVEHLAQLMGR